MICTKINLCTMHTARCHYVQSAINEIFSTSKISKYNYCQFSFLKGYGIAHIENFIEYESIVGMIGNLMEVEPGTKSQIVELVPSMLNIVQTILSELILQCSMDYLERIRGRLV